MILVDLRDQKWWSTEFKASEKLRTIRFKVSPPSMIVMTIVNGSVRHGFIGKVEALVLMTVRQAFVYVFGIYKTTFTNDQKRRRPLLFWALHTFVIVRCELDVGQ